MDRRVGISNRWLVLGLSGLLLGGLLPAIGHWRISPVAKLTDLSMPMVQALDKLANVFGKFGIDAPNRDAAADCHELATAVEEWSRLDDRPG